MAAKIDDQQLDMEVDSAGTSDYHIDEAPDKRMQETAKENNLDISHLRGRQFGTADFDEFDLIYAMDESNYENIVALARNDADRQKIKMILNEIYPGQNMPVPDPYFGGIDGFKDVYQLLDKATDKIIAQYGKN